MFEAFTFFHAYFVMTVISVVALWVVAGDRRGK